MIRGGPITWLVLVVATAATQLTISYQVKGLQDELAGLDRAIAREEDAIRVLNAEWSYLNRPGRLRNLAESLTDLGPAGAHQIIASIDEVPLPLAPQPTDAAPPAPAPKPAAAPADPIAVLLIDLQAEEDSVPALETTP